MAIVVTLALVVLLVAAWIVMNRHGRQEWERRERRPMALRQGRLFMSEREIRSRHPVPLVGRPDQVYRLSDGTLCVVDTKRRNTARVYAADVLQLSVYGVILRALHHRVSDAAFVRVVTPQGIEYVPVTLYTTEAVVNVWHRLMGLRGGVLIPSCPVHASLCKGCGHVRRCPVPAVGGH